MRHYSFIIAAAATAAAITAGCSGNSDHKGQTTSADGINSFEVAEVIKSAARTYRVVLPEGDTTWLTISTSIQWPERFGDNNIDTLRMALLDATYSYRGTDCDSAIMAFISDTSVMGDDIQATLADSVGSPDGTTAAYELEFNARVQELTEQYVTYAVSGMSYLGGAHPNSMAAPFTFAFGVDRVLTPAELFLPGHSEEVTAAVREALAAQYGVTPDNLVSAGFFTNKIIPSASVSIADGAVVFHYNPYDIAPYSAGMIDVEVQPYEIRSALTPLALKLFGLDE